MSEHKQGKRTGYEVKETDTEVRYAIAPEYVERFRDAAAERHALAVLHRQMVEFLNDRQKAVALREQRLWLEIGDDLDLPRDATYEGTTGTIVVKKETA